MQQKHRGQHSQDEGLFGTKWKVPLREAVEDLSHLLSRGYGEPSALKLVGDRYRLHKRQRMALMRASCSDEAKAHRLAISQPPGTLEGKELIIDGYNLLITTESMLAGGIILHCRDGCYRDIASVHGTYRKVEETLPALGLVGRMLASFNISQALWVFDAPVSNSGRLKVLMHELATAHGFAWDIILDNNPDKVIAHQVERLPITSDGWILDQCEASFNLPGYLLGEIEGAKVVELMH